MEKGKTLALIRSLAIELLVYGTLVTIYSVLALRYLGGHIERWFEENLVLYAFVGLVLVLAQGLLLDGLTLFLLDRLGLGRVE
jgi:hypothetical protein